MWFLLTQGSAVSYQILLTGMTRVCSLVLYSYVPSEDDHGLHHLCFMVYNICSLGWMFLIQRITIDSEVQKYRRRVLYAFITCFLGMIRYLIHHEIYHGYYSWYAFFEWAMTGLEIAFDWKSKLEFQTLEFQFWGPNIGFMSEV